jgi:hypothetical protein
MRRSPHLTDGTLWSLVWDRASPGLAARAAAHLERCSRCRELLVDLHALREHLAARWPEPREAAVIRAMALVGPPAPRRSERNRFELARLVYDGGAEEPVHAVRAAAASRHQVWRLPAADLDLRLEGAGLGADPILFGQVLPRKPVSPRPDPGTVWIVQRGAPSHWAVLGSSGEFSLPAPRPGRWTLWLEWGALRMRLVSP